MEALIALMMVTIALTGFLGMLAYSDLGGSEEKVVLDTGFIEKLELTDGKITGETQKELDRFIEKNDFNGVKLAVKVAATFPVADLIHSVGDLDGDNVGTISGTFSIASDDGRTFAASYEVAYWWD